MKPFIRVSDHAVLRFLERIDGVDIETIREFIRSQTVDAIRSGAKSLNSLGIRYVFENGVVVTVVSSRSEKSQRPADREACDE